jgi:hypothetical protein
MNHILKQAVEQNPTLKSYYLALEQVGFKYKNHSQDSKSFKILAEKDDTHLHELTITIDIDSQKASILLTTRLFWNDFEELSVPGHDVKLAIEGEYDYNYNYNHDFIITAKKRKSNVKHQDLTTTIDSMMKEIENAYQALTT